MGAARSGVAGAGGAAPPESTLAARPSPAARRGRPGRPARLSRQAILDAGLALADRDGLEALTMRRLATELGCGAMTLYTYVRDRDDLLSGIVGLLIAEVDVDVAEGGSWRETARRGAASYRAMALRHPGAFPALALGPSFDPAMHAHIRRIVDSYMAGGLSERAARDLFSVMDSYASGFLLMESAEPGGDAVDALEPLDEDAYWRGIELIIAGAEQVLLGAGHASTEGT